MPSVASLGHFVLARVEHLLAADGAQPLRVGADGAVHGVVLLALELADLARVAVRVHPSVLAQGLVGANLGGARTRGPWVGRRDRRQLRLAVLAHHRVFALSLHVPGNTGVVKVTHIGIPT